MRLVKRFRDIARDAFRLSSALILSLSVHASAEDHQATVGHVQTLMEQNEVVWPIPGVRQPENKTPDAMPVLDEALRADDPKTRLRALEGLAQSLSDENTDGFVAALADPSPDVAGFAARTLLEIDSDILFEKIIAFVSEADDAHLQAMASALPVLRDPLEKRMLSTLENQEETPKRRMAAAFCLGRMGCVAAAHPLAEVAWSDNLELSLTCLYALASLPEPAVVYYLFTLASHPTAEVRVEALRALTTISGPEAINAIGRVAIERPAKDIALSKQAVAILANMPDLKTTIPLLIETMRRNLPVRADAGAALRRVTGQRFGNFPTDWTDWWNQAKELLDAPPPTQEQAIEIAVGCF